MHAPVSRVVFLDLYVTCQCTGLQIDASWAELQKAAAGRSIAIERIHADRERPAAEPFFAMRPVEDWPGLYFLDRDGALVDTLQGRVASNQIAAVLATRP